MASPKRLVLASTSRFRLALLAGAGVTVEVEPPAVDEALILPGEDGPGGLARRRAEAKALAVARRRPDAVVIGADQVLSLAGRSFDKVEDAEAARARLSLLAGKTHILHSALCLAGADGGVARLLTSQVIDVAMPMRALTPREIEAYVATGEWRGSVGCYQFENRGVNLFDGAFGEASAIVGLPLQALLKELRRIGLNPLGSI